MRVWVLTNYDVPYGVTTEPQENAYEFDLHGAEGKVLTDRRRLLRALECYTPHGDSFYCCWDNCGWGGPGQFVDRGVCRPHSGDCPGREAP